MKQFSDLTEQEVLALAITNEEEDSRIYRGFAEGLREQFPASAKVFDEMADEEVTHRTMLFDLYRQKFGDYLPLIRRQDVKGFIQHKTSLWLMRPLGLDAVRKHAENMEFEAERFYRKAAETARDVSVRKLLIELAEAEAGHESLAHKLTEQILTPGARDKEDATSKRMFMLQYVQPGLAGLMDGSVSTLAPLFAAAFATHNTWADVPGRHGGLGRRRHFDGLRRGAVRRRLAHRPRLAGDARHRHRRHDRDRRARPYAALSHPGFLTRDRGFDRRGRDRAGGDFLDSPPLHGYAVAAGDLPGRGRRRAGVHRRHIDREFVAASSRSWPYAA